MSCKDVINSGWLVCHFMGRSLAQTMYTTVNAICNQGTVNATLCQLAEQTKNSALQAIGECMQAMTRVDSICNRELDDIGATVQYQRTLNILGLIAIAGAGFVGIKIIERIW